MKLTLLDIIERSYDKNETKTLKLTNRQLILSIANVLNVDKEEVKENIEYTELFYLDYVNNYLSVDAMIEDYYITDTELKTASELANQFIKVGRLANNNNK